jgi:hypothetical protein
VDQITSTRPPRILPCSYFTLVGIQTLSSQEPLQSHERAIRKRHHGVCVEIHFTAPISRSLTPTSYLDSFSVGRICKANRHNHILAIQSPSQIHSSNRPLADGDVIGEHRVPHAVLLSGVDEGQGSLLLYWKLRPENLLFLFAVHTFNLT